MKPKIKKAERPRSVTQSRPLTQSLTMIHPYDDTKNSQEEMTKFYLNEMSERVKEGYVFIFYRDENGKEFMRQVDNSKVEEYLTQKL